MINLSKILNPFLFIFNLLKKFNRNRKRTRNKSFEKKYINSTIKKIRDMSVAQNISNFYNSKNFFSKLCDKYGTDKGYIYFEKKTPYGWKPHSYNFFYTNLFDHCRDSIKLVFECGIGTNYSDVKSNMSSSGRPGASLRVWKDYFSKAIIYGGDIDKRILCEEDRIKTFEVDQTNLSSIKKMWSKIKVDNFDLIIDDGLHTHEAAITFFLNSFHKLRKDGIYIIEDVHFIYLDELKNSLINYDPEVVILKNDYVNNHPINDNNLIVIRKT